MKVFLGFWVYEGRDEGKKIENGRVWGQGEISSIGGEKRKCVLGCVVIKCVMSLNKRKGYDCSILFLIGV